MRLSMKMARKWLIRGGLAGAMASCVYARTDIVFGLPATVSGSNVVGGISNYEPIQYNGKDSLTLAQKAKFQEIYNFAVAAMDRHHVSARKFNQFLWQMHFFVPVHYKPFDCMALVPWSFEYSKKYGRRAPSEPIPTILSTNGSIAERVADYVAIDEAMKEINEKFPNVLPMVNSLAQLDHMRDDVHVGNNFVLADDLQIYSNILRDYMSDHDGVHYALRDQKNEESLIYFLISSDQISEHRYFDPLEGFCLSNGKIYSKSGFEINRQYVTNLNKSHNFR